MKRFFMNMWEDPVSRTIIGIGLALLLMNLLSGCVKTNINFVLTQDNATAPEISKVQVKSPDQNEITEQLSTGETRIDKRGATDTFTPTQDKSPSLELQIK